MKPLATLLITQSLLVASLAPLASARAEQPRPDDAPRQQQARPAPQQPAPQQTQPTPRPEASPRPSPSPVEIDDDEVVKVTTNLVQVDAVVTDGRGRQVTDLKAEDFEVFEDGRRQQITNFSYVDTAPAAERRPAPARPGEFAAPPQTGRARREQVRRTLAVVVDDLGMAFENVGSARRALRKFIDERVEPGDLVAIIRTGGEVGALQQFTTDKRQMRAAVERVRWNPCSRRGITSSALAGGGLFPPPPCALGSVHASLNALRFTVQGMRDLPGRKSLILFSDSLPLNERDPAEFAGPRPTDGMPLPPGVRPQGDDPGAVRPPEFRRNDRTSVADPLRQLSEMAVRASVVVYSIDTRGLAEGGTADFLDRIGSGGSGSVSRPVTSQQIAEAWATDPARRDDLEAGEVPNALTARTGGFSVRNANDIPRSLGRIMEDLRGYYLLGYRPRGETFDRRFHRVTVRVRNRPDLEVRSRRGFYGVIEEERAAPRTAADRFILALSSPFGAGDINVQLTPVFAELPPTGPFLRALLHIDTAGLTFTPDADGWERSEITLRGILFGDNGRVVDDHHHAFVLRIRGDTLRRIRAHGLEYTFNVPVKKPGAYQFRVAVLDRASSRVGSAGQFVEVPDLKKNRLALSGVVVSGAAPGSVAEATEGAVETQADPAASPSVRRFRQGALFDYSYIVYNARAEKGGPPRLLSQTRLYRDGRLVFTGEERPLQIDAQADPKRVIGGGRLGGQLPPGEYVLQIAVRDALAKGEHSTATQWIDFEIVK